MLDEMEKPEPLHVRVKRRAEAICNELWNKHKGNVREYVAECVDRFAKENLPWYDLREDDRVQYDDVVGECFSCGKPITARDICKVSAIHYTWVRKDGKNINAYRMAHKDEINERRRKRYAEDPEFRKKRLGYGAKQRAKRKALREAKE